MKIRRKIDSIINMKEKKLKIKKIMITLFFVLVILIPTYNMCTNSLYYAVHSKYTNKQKVPGLLLDHLTDIMKEKKKEKFGEYFLQSDGTNSIYYRGSKNNKKSINQDVSDARRKYYYVEKYGNKQKLYNLDKNLKIINILNLDNTEYPVTKNEQIALTNKLNKFISPLLKQINKPIINLQWFYDLIHC